MDDGEELEASDYDSAMLSISRDGSQNGTVGHIASAVPVKEHAIVAGPRRVQCCQLM